MTGVGSGDRVRRGGTIGAIVVVMAACGSSGATPTAATEPPGSAPSTAPSTIVAGDGSATTEPAPPTATAQRAVDTTTTEASTPKPPPRPDQDADVGALRTAIDNTVARRSATFELVITQTLPVPEPNLVTTRRNGRFDDSLWQGDGTMRFESANPELSQLVGGEGVFEFRIVDDTFWFLNPVAEPPGWLGHDVFEYLDATNADPTVNVDGDGFLFVVSDAIRRVTDRIPSTDGSEIWLVEVAIDAMAPTLTTGGVQRRLAAAGFDSTGLVTTAEIIVDANGMVVGLEASTDEWWQQAVMTMLPDAPADGEMRVSFALEASDEAVEVVSPCDQPDAVTEPGFPDGLTCPA